MDRLCRSIEWVEVGEGCSNDVTIVGSYVKADHDRIWLVAAEIFSAKARQKCGGRRMAIVFVQSTMCLLLRDHPPTTSNLLRAQKRRYCVLCLYASETSP